MTVRIDGVDTIEREIDLHDEHFHNTETWFGISANQAGNDWGADTLNPFIAISGNGVYGADANDEAKILGTDDTPAVSGSVQFDIRRVLIADVSVDTVYKLRVVWGTGTMADAITAGQTTEVMILSDATNPQEAAGIPLPIIVPRLASGTQVWVQCKCGTDNATIDIFVGIHEYDR